MADPLDSKVPAPAADAGATPPAVTSAQKGAGVKPPPRRFPVPQAKPKTLPFVLLIGFLVLAVVLVGGVVFLSQKMVGDATEKLTSAGPSLQKEFIDQHNNYGIRPPVGWKIRDPHDKKNIYITGPNAADFPPVVVINLEIKAGGIASYMQEHKGRLQFENKTVQFISEEPDSIDGCTNTVRFVYDLEYDPGTRNEDKTVVDSGKTVKVRTLQYIMESKPRFYRVTCHARADQFDNLLPYFEATARTFRRTKLPKLLPVPLND